MDIKKYRIIEITNDSTNIKIFKLEAVDKTKLNFVPGQFVNLYNIKDEKNSVFRQFSIASIPSKDYLEFCIKILPEGRLTSELDKYGIGEMLGIAGPFGHFSYKNQESCVFIAAGTGIAPIMSMLRHINDNRIPGKFTLFYSNKTENSIIYHNELKKLQQENENIEIIFTLTQEVPENWEGEQGRVSPEMISKYVKDADKRSWYSCGPLEFVKMIKEYAISQNVLSSNIKVEGWG